MRISNLRKLQTPATECIPFKARLIKHYPPQSGQFFAETSLRYTNSLHFMQAGKRKQLTQKIIPNTPAAPPIYMNIAI